MFENGVQSKASIKDRIAQMKNDITSDIVQANSCKEIIKDAIKTIYPKIPDRANDDLVSRLLYLDNDEVLQMGKEQIRVEDLIIEIIEVIRQKVETMYY